MKNDNIKVSSSEMIRKMIKDIGKNKHLVIFSVLIITAAKIALSIAPRISGEITDFLAEAVQTGDFRIRWIAIQCLILAALYLFGNGADGFVNRNMVKISQSLSLKLRNDAQKKLNRLDFSYLDNHPAGDILSRITNDILTLTNSIESTLPTLVGQFVLLAGVVVMMLVTNPKLTLIYAVTLPLSFLITSFIAKKTNVQFKNQQDAVGNLNAMVSDSYSNHMVLKAYCCENSKLDDFDKLNRDFYKTYVKSRFLSGFMIPIGVLANNVSYIVLCVAGGIMLINQTLSIGEFQAFLFY